MKNIFPEDERKACITQLLETPEEAVKNMINIFRSCLTEMVNMMELFNTQFSFLEKILLPSLFKQTSGFHFVNSLKSALFGIHDTNNGSFPVYKIPKDHWLNEETEIVLFQCCTIYLWERWHKITLAVLLEKFCCMKKCFRQEKNRFFDEIMFEKNFSAQ